MQFENRFFNVILSIYYVPFENQFEVRRLFKIIEYLSVQVQDALSSKKSDSLWKRKSDLFSIGKQMEGLKT